MKKRPILRRREIATRGVVPGDEAVERLCDDERETHGLGYRGRVGAAQARV